MRGPRRPLIAGNWKMNTTSAEATALARAVASVAAPNTDVMICPPFVWLATVAESVTGSHVLVGAQDCWPKPNGAWTGGISTTMLKELVSAVIVGHSERRQSFGDSNELVRAKLEAVLDADLTAILCVGESLEIRQRGDENAYVERQLVHALNGLGAVNLRRVVVAYEPIWAIGTGVAASSQDAEHMSAHLRNVVDAIAPGTADTFRILYGGSVTPANSAEILQQSNVDGALIGGASLKADQFLEIVRIADD